jgi:diguanylate cyclase (GGDEF)-like protein
MAGTLIDITERKRAESRLRHSALHDPLTGLANRVLLVDRISHAIAARRRPGLNPFALLYFDLDRFKEINDTLGHLVGDKVLVGIGRRLREFLRPGDTVARVGGDEFAVLLGEVAGVENAAQVAERILSTLEKPLSIDGRHVSTGASIGVALGNGAYDSADNLLRDADLAMYRAKSAGRGGYQVFDQHMHRSTAALLRMESELREAVEKKRFEVHYQPIVTLQTGRIVGFEALVRWQHPERGLIPPRQFIAIAEETGLIVPLGWWVLREACGQAHQWHQRFRYVPPLTMSVNVSGKLFMQEDMVGTLLTILEDTGLAPETLRLELTENVVLEQGESAFIRLLELRALGVHSSIDDFGTGYSSLSCLQRSQCESLKIDPAFVGAIDRVGSSGAMVQTIVDMAGSMGIKVIAEGVETAEQAHRLKRMQCPQGQGYWFARPLTPDAAEQLLASPPTW